MSLELDRQRLEVIIRTIGERAAGEWLLVGGALVSIWLEPRRVTEDVDVVGLQGTPQERYQLMEIASDLGLPIEAVNSAADFFVRRIPGWRSEIEVLHQGERGTIYRPTATLFLLLKIERLSEQDLADCRAVIGYARTSGMPVDPGRVLASLDSLPLVDDDRLLSRRAELRHLLAEILPSSLKQQ